MSYGRFAAALSTLMAIALIVMMVFAYIPLPSAEPATEPACTGEAVVNDLGETVCLDPDCPVHGISISN